MKIENQHIIIMMFHNICISLLMQEIILGTFESFVRYMFSPSIFENNLCHVLVAGLLVHLFAQI